MKEGIKKSIKKAQEIVDGSGVSQKYAVAAFKIILNRLLQGGDIDVSEDKIVSKKSDKLVARHSYKDYSTLIEEKVPKGDYEVIACVVYFFTVELGEDAVEKEEIKDFIRENPQGIKRSDDVDSAIDHTKNMYRYIELVSKNDRRYRLSVLGRQIVDILPDREKNNPKKKRSRKNKELEGRNKRSNNE